MRHSSFVSLLVVSSLGLLACGGNVVDGTGGDASTSTTTTTSIGEGGSGGEGGSTQTTSTTTTSTTTTTTSTTTGTGGAPSVECAAMEPIVLSNPKASPAFHPGESATISVTLTNTSAEDIDYPGIIVESNHPGVTSMNPTNYFFLIFAGQSNPIDVTFTADASVPKGTKVVFDVRVIDIQATLCTNVDGLSFEATIE